MSDHVELENDLARVAQAKAAALGVDLTDVIDGLLRAWVGNDPEPDECSIARQTGK